MSMKRNEEKARSSTMAMKRIEEEARSSTKTTPLEKQKSLASLNVPSSISASTGWCKRNSTRRGS